MIGLVLHSMTIGSSSFRGFLYKELNNCLFSNYSFAANLCLYILQKKLCLLIMYISIFVQQSKFSFFS